jgi:hypothetical protein
MRGEVHVIESCGCSMISPSLKQHQYHSTKSSRDSFGCILSTIGCISKYTLGKSVCLYFSTLLKSQPLIETHTPRLGIHSKVPAAYDPGHWQCQPDSSQDQEPACSHITRAGGADQDGHPGGVKARRGGRRAEEGTRAGVH